MLHVYPGGDDTIYVNGRSGIGEWQAANRYGAQERDCYLIEGLCTYGEINCVRAVFSICCEGRQRQNEKMIKVGPKLGENILMLDLVNIIVDIWTLHMGDLNLGHANCCMYKNDSPSHLCCTTIYLPTSRNNPLTLL
ncbi:hypothetical protein JTE90_024352 [Oedothorax gibbosus]|uniref:Uncharacterized protein n=1 Tax=Oedothorax gibbosus TaxID=931172 RepID=A0AAV6VXW9_9ARAC|nr:hypothetical protein JTE90_024352 [Oedothorax gibbosus]